MLLETTPDTSAFMIAGYTVAFVVMGLYVASLFIRNRNLDRDAEMLKTLFEAESSPSSKKEAGKSAKKPAPKKKSVSKKK